MAERKTAPVPDFFERDGFPGETSKVAPLHFVQAARNQIPSYPNTRAGINQMTEDLKNGRFRYSNIYQANVFFRYISEPLSKGSFLTLAATPQDLETLVKIQRRIMYDSETKEVTLNRTESPDNKNAYFSELFTKPELEPDMQNGKPGPKDKWANALLAANLVLQENSNPQTGTTIKNAQDLLAFVSAQGLHLDIDDLRLGFVDLTSRDVVMGLTKNGTTPPENLEAFFTRASDWLISLSQYDVREKSLLVVEPYPLYENHQDLVDIRFVPYIVRAYMGFVEKFRANLTPQDKIGYYRRIGKFIEGCSQKRNTRVMEMDPTQSANEPRFSPKDLEKLNGFLETLKKAVTN